MKNDSLLPPVIAVVGPTASGKSALGLELALRYEGEIVNCDSVQVYRDIEIATAKVPLSERRGVPHHLLDFVPPEINYTAGAWAEAARVKIAEINLRGHIAILVGGTGLYLRALRQPLFESPPTDEGLRSRLTRLRERRGAQHLHRMLRRVDPASAARLHPRDWSRTQRALEVCFQTRRPMSEQLSHARHAPTKLPHIQLAPKEHEPTEHTSTAKPDEEASPLAHLRIFALLPPREELYARINRRTEEHFAAGLVEEVRTLLERGVPATSNALGAHGYRRVVEHLRGERTLESAIEQTKLDVRHYAKRQLTWFRREPGVEWIEGFGDDEQAVSKVEGRRAKEES